MRPSNFIITMTAAALILPMIENADNIVWAWPHALFIVDATATAPNNW